MGGELGATDLHLRLFVAAGLAMTNLLYGYFVLPESLPTDQRKKFSWKSGKSVASMRALENCGESAR